MRKIFLLSLVLILMFAFTSETMAQSISIRGNASYWGGHFWVGASARVQLTENLSARASFSSSVQRYYRASVEGIYDFRLTEGFNPYAGAGVGYSTFRGANVDLIGGLNVRIDRAFRLNAEVTYTIFLDPAYRNRVGFSLGTGFSL